MTTPGNVLVMIAADETYPRTTIDLPGGGTVHTTTSKRFVGITDGEVVDRADALADTDGDLVFDKQTNRYARGRSGGRRLESWDAGAWGVAAV